METLSVSELIKLRNAVSQAWRGYFLGQGALEVETPVLHRCPDIAPVKQFVTTHPTTGEIGYLRIAPTEYLKRLLAEGVDSVFEYSRNFRDDVVDSTHLPEFTSVEYMVRNKSVDDMEATVEQLCGLAIGEIVALRPRESLPGWVRQWPEQQIRRLNLAETLAECYNFQRHAVHDRTAIQGVLDSLGVTYVPGDPIEHLLDLLVTHIAESHEGAVLVSGFPLHLGGPAEPHPAHPGYKQRSELYVNGLEVANMSSNLTDLNELRTWHNNGVKKKQQLGIHTNQVDHELLNHLDGKLPPSAVIGIGVERMLQATLKLNRIPLIW